MSFAEPPSLRGRLAQRMPQGLADLLLGMALVLWLPILVAIGQKTLPGFLFIAAFLLLPFLLLAVLAWLILGVAGLVRSRGRAPGYSGIWTGFGLGLILILPAAWMSAWLLDWVDLAVHRSAWERIARSAPAMPADRRGRWLDREGVSYVIDRADPRRVAFPDPDGLLDDWSGYVFDPTGRAGRAAGGAPPADVERWFGGDLVNCRSMAWSFYHCSFT